MTRHYRKYTDEDEGLIEFHDVQVSLDPEKIRSFLISKTKKLKILFLIR